MFNQGPKLIFCYWQFNCEFKSGHGLTLCLVHSSVCWLVRKTHCLQCEQSKKNDWCRGNHSQWWWGQNSKHPPILLFYRKPFMRLFFWWVFFFWLLVSGPTHSNYVLAQQTKLMKPFASIIFFMTTSSEILHSATSFVA